MPKDNDRLSVWSYLRFATPLLIGIALFMIGDVKNEINEIDQKMFTHLTNDDLHIPRGYVVTKAEFDLINRIREGQFIKIEQGISDLRSLCMTLVKEGRINGK